MAGALENTWENASSSSASLAVTVSPSANSLLIGIFSGRGGTANAPTDNGTGSWTVIEESVVSGSSQAGGVFYYKVAAGDETTVTFTASVVGRCSAIVAEYSGITTSSPLEDSAENVTYITTEQTSGDPINCGSATPVSANGMAVAAIMSPDARDGYETEVTINDSYTKDEYSVFIDGAYAWCAVAHKNYTSTAAQSPDWDTSTTGGWYAYTAIAVFKEADGGGSITGSGALSSQASVISGAGIREITGSGALTDQASTIAGTGTVGGTVTGSGALSSQSSAIAGVGVREIIGSGALTDQASIISGTGTTTPAGSIIGSGVLACGTSAVSGSSIVGRVGTGTIVVESSTISGTGVIGRSGSGALSAQASTISGVGGVPGSITGSGALVCSVSSISGTGVKSGWSEVPPSSSIWVDVSGGSNTWETV
jgi:hypothetical protein